MQFTAFLAVVLGAVTANAGIGAIAAPKTIKAGDTIQLRGYYGIGQGSGDYAVIFGIQQFGSTYMGDSLGTMIAGPFDPSSLYTSMGNISVPNVYIPSDLGKGPATIMAGIVSLSGVYRSMSLRSTGVNITIGDITSAEYVYTGNSQGNKYCSLYNSVLQ